MSEQVVNLEEIMLFISETANIDLEKLRDRSLEVVDLGLDSLAITEMLFDLEDKFKVSIPNSVAAKPNLRMGDLYDAMLEEQIAAVPVAG